MQQAQNRNYDAYMNHRKAAVEQALENYLKPEDGFQNIIEEGMFYAVCGGGKRLRPLLLLEGAALAGLDTETVMPAACSIELLHTYSLVHDDLPAMDNDELRRGRPTCHIQFGEANAILIGDALLTKAFELLSRLVSSPQIAPQSVLRTVELLGKAAGSRGMVGGQCMDLCAETMPPETVDLETLHDLKTGALLSYALTAGAVLGGMEEAEIEVLQTYAHCFGMAFQITDDILDVVGDAQTLGKPVGSDEKNSKATYVSRWGLDGARKLAQQYVDQAVEAIHGIHGNNGNTGFLEWLVRGLLSRKM